jgi:hypothetical protein
MSDNKAEKQSYQAVLVRLKEEMAEPRSAESAQIETERQCMVTVKGVAKT